MSPGSSRAADTRSGQAELASASSQSNPNASQKTGLTIQIRNGWRDFRFREKFLEREEIGKRFQVENQGFRGVQVRKGALRLGVLGWIQGWKGERGQRRGKKHGFRTNGNGARR